MNVPPGTLMVVQQLSLPHVSHLRKTVLEHSSSPWKLAVYEIGIARVGAEVARADLPGGTVLGGLAAGPAVLVRCAREAGAAR